MRADWKRRLDGLKGDKSVWMRNLRTGETFAYCDDLALNAASVIKIPVMLEAYRAERDIEISMGETLRFSAADLYPSCGVLTYIQPFGVSEMPIAALVELMIIVSDNTAANLLIDRLGITNINRTLHALHMEKTMLRRRLFDADASAKGIENTINVREIGELLCRLLPDSSAPAISREADKRMLETLSHQRLNGKIPFALQGCLVAHKTGEDSGITHDVGLVFDKETRAPLCALCFASEHMETPEFERFMQDISREFVEECRKG